jgi:ferric-dicitrate binding protein FerR (iron transport regulator)
MLSYPSYFDGETRTIELIGEAFFDVAHDKNKPFIINSGNLKVNVLGTSFNFKHYEEDTHAVLAVETGTVALSAGSATPTTLIAGKYALVDNHTLQTNVYSTPQTGLAAWRDNKMIFRDEPFGNILNELSRRYNVIFEINDEEINRYIYTATFNNMNLEDVLTLLKISSPIDFSIQNLTLNTSNAYGARQIKIYRK